MVVTKAITTSIVNRVGKRSLACQRRIVNPAFDRHGIWMSARGGGSACESNTPSPVKDDRRF